MVYRGLNIGTSKPSQEMLKELPHHLINILEPFESYSAADFCKDAERLAGRFMPRKYSLLVGGTMLYFRALQKGLSDLPSADAGTRARILSEAGEQGWQAMHQKLAKIDPVAAHRIHPNDPQRLQRALEVYEITGEPISAFMAEKTSSAVGVSFY